MTKDNGWDNPESDEDFGVIEDPGCLTKEESGIICNLLDENDLTENEDQFINDLAELEEYEPITERQRDWLEQLAAKYEV